MGEREVMDEEACSPRNQSQRLGYQPEMKEPPRRRRAERVTEKASHNSDDSIRLENKPYTPPLQHLITLWGTTNSLVV